MKMRVFKETVCPLLMLELVGPYFRISALASVTDVQVLCEPITPFLHFFNMISHDRPHMIQLACTLRAFKNSVKLLDDFYMRCKTTYEPKNNTKASKMDPSPRNPELQLPYSLRHLTNCLVQPIDFGPKAGRKLILSISPHPSPSPPSPSISPPPTVKFIPPLTVKFIVADRYGEEVHAAWAKESLAPQLLSPIQILPGGTVKIEMEHLRQEDGWICLCQLSSDKKSEWLPHVQAALDRAHSVKVGASGRLGAHGDLRSCNLMVRTQESDEMEDQDISARVCFVDFDWAGQVGEACLPPFARSFIPHFPSGSFLTQQYDQELLKLDP